MQDSFDVIVIGGGHAGCEAAAAAARLEASVALVTLRADRVGAMSCNPAIGGLGKGHLVREIDACDGVIGRAADDAAIHYRMLNRSKGAAVRGPRIQADRTLFARSVRSQLAEYGSLSTIEGEVARLLLDRGRVAGVVLADGRTVRSRAVVLASGTFLGGILHFGLQARAGGRVGEGAATILAEQLRSLALPMGRMKTGTPPRLDGRTIDWSRLVRQETDAEDWTMSQWRRGRSNPQLFCAITRTNAATHEIIRAALNQSPLHSGAIEGRGPRYCPSIEDKIARFGDRDGHQIFLEPEAAGDALVYPNGISTSLPTAVQERFLRTIDGLSQVRIAAPGYAVEYDHVDPRCLGQDLQLRAVKGLFLAGQVNGTTGYEEAAAQGLVAGLNAARFSHEEAPILFDRSTSYIGVMIDDLTLQGVSEPYRMLTARAEFRLSLRSDNAFSRLGPIAAAAGVLRPPVRMELHDRLRRRKEVDAHLAASIDGGDLRRVGAEVSEGGRKPASEWLRYPGIGWVTLVKAFPALAEYDTELGEEAVEDARYAPYLERQQKEIALLRSDRSIQLARTLRYADVAGLSSEMRERLEAARPRTLADAGHIRGITPAALAALLVYAERKRT